MSGVSWRAHGRRMAVGAAVGVFVGAAVALVFAAWWVALQLLASALSGGPTLDWIETVVAVLAGCYAIGWVWDRP